MRADIALQISRESRLLYLLNFSQESINSAHHELAKAKILEIRLRKIVQIREDTLNVVSHDLKNPLAVIEGAVELIQLAEEDNYKNLSSLTGMISRSTSQMRKLVADLLDFGKIQNGSLAIEKSKVQFDKAVHSIISDQKVIADKKNQKLDGCVSDQVSTVDCDLFRINQVLTNLIGNAIKFTPNRGQICVKVDRQEQNIITSVSDSGPGIASDNLSKIFDRYWQGQVPSHSGCGLGLSIAKGLVEAHGGKIWAESQIGNGSTFYFTIPC